MAGTLLLRADAGPGIGAGHLMRCLALAQAWGEAGGRAVLAAAELAPALAARAAREFDEVVAVAGRPGSREDARATARIARQGGAGWIVLDGYAFGDAYEEEAAGGGARLLALDDCGHADHRCADAVLNQNLHATAALYPRRGPHTALLLGPRYCLLRREFRARPAPRRRPEGPARRVLVTFGGADPLGLTEEALEALALLPEAEALDCAVAVGGANPRAGSIARAAEAAPFRCRVHRDPPDLAALMAWADLALTAAGSTCWELAHLGVPAAAVVVAENQIAHAQALAEAGTLCLVGRAGRLPREQWAEEIRKILGDPRARERMAHRGPALVDGQGAVRVVEHLAGAGAEPIRPGPQAEPSAQGRRHRCYVSPN
ncbi:MAG: UDP-2,4-diacetamido-2,4,6-trideoxy-beta-L-altropyranose hydrolase [Deferrisomatales bacterium]